MNGGTQGRRDRPERIRFLPVLRPEDLLVLEVGLADLRIVAEGEKAFLVPEKNGDPRLILRFPPQNVAEQAFFEQVPAVPVSRPPGAEPDPDAGFSFDLFGVTVTIPRPGEQPSIPARTLIAGPSRLVFKVPEDAEPILFTVGGILDAARSLELSVHPGALPPEDPPLLVRWPPWVVDLLVTEAEGKVLTVTQKSKLLRWAAGSELVMAVRAGAAAPEAGPPDDAALRLPAGRRLADMLKIAPVALRPELLYPRLRQPARTETALELPFRLILSPNRHAAWAHALAPVASPKTGRVELWHTRLATRVKDAVEEGDHRLRTVRALWARSGPTPNQRFDTDLAGKPPHSNEPFRMSLDPADRFDVVHLTANFGIGTGRRRYRPRPVDVARLMLTSLGAWIDSRGAWEPPPGTGLSVEEWRHRGTMARDHYVRVVYKGYLFPFGHRASLVKITERKFHGDRPGNPGFLRQRMFIVVRQPLKTYGGRGLAAPDGRRYDNQMPFTAVRVLTLVTPDLDDPAGSDYPTSGQGLLQACFWPRVGGQDFRFRLAAEDLEGNRVEFMAPLLFASVDLDPATKVPVSTSTALLTTVRDDYEASAARSEVAVRGQRVALAPSTTPGDTSFEAATLAWGAEIPGDAVLAALGADHPRFYPRLVGADVVVPAVRQFTGAETATRVRFAQTFLTQGFGTANRGEVFLDVAGSLGLDFSHKGDRAGGLVQPNLQVKGLSRLLGPVSGATDLTQITAGTFSPADFFAAMGAKLFGVIDLAAVIRAVGLDDLAKVPRFVTETLTAAQSLTQDVQRLLARLQELKSRVDALGAGFNALKAQVATAAAALQSDAATIAADLSGLLDGTVAPVKLQTDLTAFRNDVQAARGLLGAMPPEVPADLRQSLDASFGAFLGDLADAAGFAAAVAQALQLPEELRMRFDWRPDLQDWPSSKPIFVASKDGTAATLTISAEIQAKTKIKPEPRIDIACRLQNFTLDLIAPVASFLRLRFDTIEFTMTAGQKPDVNVGFAGVEFVGVLSFVEALRDLIPLDGFSDPPALEVSEKGVQAGYSLALPNVAFGVFSLQNLSLGAGFTVPFLVDPLSARFQFCERQSPCLLTVSMFGGGAFFGITIDPGGVQILEAAFEFGASVSLDFGVASGGVYVMGGFYFKTEGDAASLTGYLRIGGEVEVLGIVSVSIELRMELTYEFSSGKCVGRATLTIEIEIAFFSTSVEISVERKFAGSNGDPTFAELMRPDPADPAFRPWQAYCEAFADA